MKGSVKSHIKQAIPSLVIMVFMVGAASAMSSRFFTAANLRNVLTQTAVLAIVSAAQCFALLIGGIDMSVSSVISVSTIFVAMFSHSGPAGLAFAIALALAVGAFTGFVNGMGIVRFQIPAMIITISTQAFLKGIALILMPSSGGKVNQAFVKVIKTRVGIFSVAFLLAVLTYASAWLVLHYTRFGRRIYAVGNGELYAEQSGIDTKKITVMVYVLSGLIAAFGGIILSARISSGNPLVGDSYAMDSVAAAVIGGVSTLGGSGLLVGVIAGAAVWAILQSGLTFAKVPVAYRNIVIGILVVACVLFDVIRRNGSKRPKSKG